MEFYATVYSPIHEDDDSEFKNEAGYIDNIYKNKQDAKKRIENCKDDFPEMFIKKFAVSEEDFFQFFINEFQGGWFSIPEEWEVADK